MPNIDPEWHTGEFEPIKPVAPSTRGKPQRTPTRQRTSDTPTDSVATDQGQSDEAQWRGRAVGRSACAAGTASAPRRSASAR